MYKFFLSVIIGMLIIFNNLYGQQRDPQLPNIVIILTDDLGYGDVSFYNEHAAFKTPNIDKLAERGMSFMEAYTGASVCTPTRYGLLTGRYNWRSELKKGVLDGYAPSLIKKDRLTIADLLRNKGYHTAMVGKWHLGWKWKLMKEQPNNKNIQPAVDFSQPIENGPEDHGFTYSYAIVKSLSAPPYVYVKNSLPTSIPHDTSVNYDETAFWNKGPIGSGFKHVQVLPHLTNKSVEYINKQASSNAPFFLYYALTAPHAPIVPTDEFIGKSNTNAYGDFVLEVDSMVGRIMDALKKNHIYKNTIVVFTSDNGPSPRRDFYNFARYVRRLFPDGDNSPSSRGDSHKGELSKAGHSSSYIFRGQKSDIYGGGLRVPFIVSWPDKIKEKSTSNEIISTVDLMATAADIVGTNLPDNAGEDSYSFLPVLLQQEYSKPLREATVLHSGRGRFAIRKGKWKLILWPGSGGWSYPSTKKEIRGLPSFQLYNLKADPSEEHNIVYLYPKKVKELKSLLEKYIRRGRSTPGASQQNDGPKRWPELDWMDL